MSQWWKWMSQWWKLISQCGMNEPMMKMNEPMWNEWANVEWMSQCGMNEPMMKVNGRKTVSSSCTGHTMNTDYVTAISLLFSRDSEALPELKH